jgi:preprotein translocase subunit SecB
MDNKKQPGIIFTGTTIKKLSFELNSKFTQPKEPIQLGVHLEHKNNIIGNKLECELYIELFKNVENAPFKLEIALLGIFEKSEQPNMELEEFGKVNAPALMIPYLRELVDNISSRTFLPPILLPPINIAAFINEESK